jgi:hypothetical protein
MTTLTGLVLLAGDNAVITFIDNIKTIAIAAITLFAIIKLAPLIMRGKATQIIAAVAVCATVIYFANNTGSFDSIGDFFANMFKS